MKPILLALVLACFRVACRGAQPEPTNPPVSSFAKGASGDEAATFKTETEAIEHFQKALADSKGTSMRAIYAAFGIPMDAGDRDESTARTASMMRLFAAHSGALSRVDKCLGPKLGDTIQRAGYILLYEHGFGFVDASLFHTEKGWRVLNLKLDFNSDTEEIVKAIPGEYYLGAQTTSAASKAPAPTPAKTASALPDWSAFSLVEPDENGGCTETVYLVNERAAPTTFDGNLVVNPGESVRFVHIIAGDYLKNLTRSFQVPGQGAVPVKPVVLKGMAPYPDGN